MRLLNSNTLEFEEFFESDRPKYGILSHRWGKEECDLKDFRTITEAAKDGTRTRQTLGYSKIVDFCRLARQQSLEWVWVDTCCIDRSSSAELGEAINSMYRWYADSDTCFVFLDDFDSSEESFQRPGAYDKELTPSAKMAFRRSEWFTRGWTLQELLAPEHVHFYSQRWEFLGNRDDKNGDFTDLVSQATGIERKYIIDHTSCKSVAEKMSWAANRRTSRLEDRAYSLLGLFDVNMPLIYGEGRKAFQRLQREIINQVDDESIFAWWTKPGSSLNQKAKHGLLAESPDDFALSSGVYPVTTVLRPPGTITSRGLHLQTALLIKKDFTLLLRLNCRYLDHRPVFIEIGQVEEIAKQARSVATGQRPDGIYYRASTGVNNSSMERYLVHETGPEHIYLALEHQVLRHRVGLVHATLAIQSVNEPNLDYHKTNFDTRLTSPGLADSWPMWDEPLFHGSDLTNIAQFPSLFPGPEFHIPPVPAASMSLTAPVPVFDNVPKASGFLFPPSQGVPGWAAINNTTLTEVREEPYEIDDLSLFPRDSADAHKRKNHNDQLPLPESSKRPRTRSRGLDPAFKHLAKLPV